MQTQIQYDQPPAGTCLTPGLKGENILICTKGAWTSRDGNDLIVNLEAIWSLLDGEMEKAGVQPSIVDHLLVVFGQKSARVYCNELQMNILARAGRPIQAGESLEKQDLADIERLEFMDKEGSLVDIQPDEGIAVVLSVGWRKCLFFDLEVLGVDGLPRSADIAKTLGQMYRHLLFEEMYSISDQQWENMLEWGWFPFVWMTTRDRDLVISFSVRSAEPRELFEEICERFESNVDDLIDSWMKNGILLEHREFIEAAARHYHAGDYLSAIQVLFPRIEGVMRKLHLLNEPGKRARQGTMATTVVSGRDSDSLLLPERFREYLLSFYFRAFDQEAGDVPLSRHTVAHGASLPEDYDHVTASLGFMILDQMFYYLPKSTE